MPVGRWWLFVGVGIREGSQPLGIFRPVVLETTDEIRIEPFGVHIWNDEKAANVFVETEVKNYGKTAETIEVVNKLSNGRTVNKCSVS